jgi:hypothetical protein
VTKPSFGASLLTFARSDALPLEGPKAAYLLNQLKPIREALEVMEERWRESLQADGDAIPGWHLVPGPQVRELKGATALDVWNQFEGADDYPLTLKEFLACCRPVLTTMEEAIRDTEGLEPDRARSLLNRLLADLLTYRQNRSSLRRLNGAEAIAQAVRLEGKGQ